MGDVAAFDRDEERGDVDEEPGDDEGDELDSFELFSFGDDDLKRLDRLRKLPLPNMSPALGCNAQ